MLSIKSSFSVLSTVRDTLESSLDNLWRQSTPNNTQAAIFTSIFFYCWEKHGVQVVFHQFPNSYCCNLLLIVMNISSYDILRLSCICMALDFII